MTERKRYTQDQVAAFTRNLTQACQQTRPGFPDLVATYTPGYGGWRLETIEGGTPFGSRRYRTDIFVRMLDQLTTLAYNLRPE